MDQREHVRPWFPAKRYGWGWGLPTCWQGWTVLLGFLVALLSGGLMIDPHIHPLGYGLHALGCSALLIAVCWWKGERPRWRWGDDEKH